MKRFTQAGREAIEKSNWYAGLTIALTMPDICAALEKPGSGMSEKHYIEWCRKWLEPHFTRQVGYPTEARSLLSAEDLYRARCGIIRSEPATPDEERTKLLDDFKFFSDGSHFIIVTGAMVDGVTQSFLRLRVDMFCETVFAAAEAWDAAVSNSANIKSEKANLLVIHPPGTTFGGVYFG